MTMLAAQNQKYRTQDAQKKRKQFLIRFATVSVGLILFIAVVTLASNTPVRDCVDQGQPIECSMLNN